VFETENGLLVIVALPGVQPDEMETVIGNGELRVRGIRRWPAPQHPIIAHRIELPHGRFERRLPLPHGTYQLVGQEHENGCLVLTLKRRV
jgi:HSP20 family molecular chaperone IbpA